MGLPACTLSAACPSPNPNLSRSAVQSTVLSRMMEPSGVWFAAAVSTSVVVDERRLAFVRPFERSFRFL